MKNAWVVSGMVAVHCAVMGALTLSGGCGTVGKQTPPPEQPVMLPPPPPEQPLPPVTVKPIKVEPAVPELTTKTYQVKSGDSLSLIAKRFHVSKADMMKLNKISDANKIRVGQKLKLPGYVDLNAPVPEVRKAHKPAAKAGKAAPAAVAGGSEYAVVSGDTLGGIAHRHGTTVKALKQVNNLTSDKLHVGQKLALPKGAAPSGETAKPTEVAPAPAPAEGTPSETAVAPGTAPDSGVPPAPASNEVLHVVEPNQDLSSIAMMYGVRAEEIIRLNNLASPDVKVGQTLKIPPPVE